MGKSAFREKRQINARKTSESSVDTSNADQDYVKSPTSGRRIKIATAIRQGFMNETIIGGNRHLEWADHAFPPETQREKEERLESRRIMKFIIEDNPDLPPLWALGATIKKEDGHLRLWFEISEGTRWKAVSQRLKALKQWKRRLVRFVGERDPQPLPIPVILEDLEKLKGKRKHAAIVENINSWVSQKLYELEKAKGLVRSLIDSEIFGVLGLFDFEDAAINDMLNIASSRIARGQVPFPQCENSFGVYYPVTPEKLKSISRKWKKRSIPLA